MTLITFQDGKPVFRDGKVGTGQGCCCGPQCDCSSPGYAPISPSDPTRGLVWLTLDSCTGSGASATVDAPNAASLCDNQGGAIQGVTLTSPGSGYAKLGRTAPTVTVTGTSGSGSGGTFAVTLTQWQNYCGLDEWGVESVSLTGGEGYTPGDTLTFSFASGDTQETAAAGTIVGTQFGEPTLTLTPTGGTGGVLTIKNYTKSGDYWQIGDIEVTQAGSGYADDSPVTITLDPGVVDAQPYGYPVPPLIRVRTALRAPEGDYWILDPGTVAPTGTGLDLSMTLQKHPTAPWWEGAALGVYDGGTGYAVGQRFRPRAVDGDPASTLWRANIEITEVDANGGVVALVFRSPSVAFQPRGQYAVGTGAIDSVEFQLYPGGSPPPWRGAYKKAVQFAVNLTSAGAYYREDPTLPPYVPSVTVTVEQEPPSAGSGAVVTATVNDDTSSPDFGKIKSLQVVDGGSGYLNPPSACEFPNKLYVTFGNTTVEVPTTTDSFTSWFTLPGSPVGTLPDGLGASFPLAGPQDYSPEAMTGICTAGDCCVNTDSVGIPVADLLNMTPPFQQVEDAFRAFVWKSFSLSFGLVIRPSQYSTTGDYGPLGAKILACQCDEQVHISLALVSYCYQYRPTGPSTVFNNGAFVNLYGLSVEVLRRKVFLYCLRFDKDENGCPVGDATIINTTVMDSGPPDCAPAEDWYGNLVTDCTCNTECFEGINPVVSLMPP